MPGQLVERLLVSSHAVLAGPLEQQPALPGAHVSQLLEGLITDLARSEGFAIANPRLASIGLSAMLDGLWLEWCLNPTTFSAEDGLQLSRHWVEGLRRGAYA